MPSTDPHSSAMKRSFTKSLFWLGSAQVLGRVVRLASSIILARLLTPEVFGEVAIILTCFELICTPTRRITSASLIKMDKQHFQAALKPAHKINWYASILAFVAMSLLSWPLSYYHQDSTLIPPMILMATSYLLLPFGMLHAAANLRANKMRIVGRAILWQTVGDGVLTGALALLGLGIWAIIIPKVLVILIWIGIHRYHNPLREESESNHLDVGQIKMPNSTINNQSEHHVSIKELLHFGGHVGLSDLSIALRQNIDYLLVGYFLGIEALGVYFFAFNASLGISSAIVQGYGTALYSHLCSCNDADKDKPKNAKMPTTPASNSTEIKSRYLHSLSVIFKITVPIVVLQAVLSPLYLPFVYGAHWIDAGALPVFILLCISGLVRPLGEAASQLLISINLQQQNLTLNIGFTLLLVLTICLCSQWGLTGIALGILLIHLIAMPAISFYVYFFTLNNIKPTASQPQSTASTINNIQPRTNAIAQRSAGTTTKAFNQEVSHDA
ncbi:oligosaccharide flippase family protein [Shewanella eurypsychrophilus]|uniref:Oligosaccharide flippase family protein n=1 Tax=Shewanella eurypsychrophilus TaxID=2593656 RepID=A0ABX6V7M2_9GAMM|nr:MULTISPECIES: oligosaccharide flippase family protein [Shewanella]QFU23414.1 oligosaccharide flippase family protein [Shewanella sp. YLB-09]QPG58642.1 oligosaccharide flippase family protein [Shewanella eurypsychrophilus]